MLTFVGQARGRVNVARLLLDMLPPELATITTPEERTAEYLDYRQFFIAWETLERATECQALEAPQVSRDTRTAWIRDYGVRVPLLSYLYHQYSRQWIQGLVSTAREQALKLLTTDWLVPEGEIPPSASLSTTNVFLYPLSLTGQHPAADRRVRELARIRQLFVPELILRLHTLLVSSRIHLSECVVTSVTSFARSSPLSATCGKPCAWRISSRTRGTCCSPSLRGRTDAG